MSLHHVNYYSDALGMATGAYVIHPDPDVKGPYHCMFLLHGLSDDYTIWQRRTSIERYVQGKPVIVIMPDGGRGFYVDAIEGFAYLKALAYELPALINHWYDIKGKWSTAGLSMGGYGALRVALERPDLFVSAVSHSGAVMHGNCVPSKATATKWDEEFLRVFGDCTNGGANDIVALAEKAKPRPAIRFDCGTEDYLLHFNRQLHSILAEKGIAHEYEEFPGDHNWEYWDLHVQEAIKFNLKHMA
jgi:putative tributyrin esterase